MHFDREAESLDGVLRRAIADVQAEGWQVREISVEANCVLPLPSG